MRRICCSVFLSDLTLNRHRVPTRLFLYYLDFSFRLAKLIIRRIFAILLTLFVFVAFAYIGVVSMW